MECRRCGAAFSPFNAASMYCSNACKVAACKERSNPARRRVRSMAEISAEKIRREAENVRQQLERRAARASIVAAREAIKNRKRMCRCGSELTTPRVRLCETCLGQNRAASKRISRLSGKARKRAATVERVDPVRVFERDRWKCQLCGSRTPKRRRGSYEANAPEIDHIVPLALGGSHSYVNVQCACRKCNIAKSATVRGQILMFG